MEHSDNDSMQIAQVLDARGLTCPLPILRTKKALSTLTSGQVIRVLADDPGSVKDFEAFARQTGNTLLSSLSPAEGQFEFLLQRR